MMAETHYVLEGGSTAHPLDVMRDAQGVLRHKDGRAVALRANGTPRSRSVEVDERTGKPPFGGKGDHDGDGRTGGSAPRDMKPEEPHAAAPKRYKTRETKAD